jgi:inner membrane transporter RhtA
LLALLGSRAVRNLVAIAFATGGIYILTDVRIAGEPIGFVWAFVNAALFTFYIILAHWSARADSVTSPVDRLGASMLVAGIVITPFGLSDALPGSQRVRRSNPLSSTHHLGSSFQALIHL